jgi:curved DNA-binding protein CbpA
MKSGWSRLFLIGYWFILQTFAPYRFLPLSHVFASTAVNDTYEWEHWDHYKILGLDRNVEYNEKEIKKAYRKQAQQWHPDKLVGDNTTTTQEGNDRFARVAEAYQVLSKEKQEYDNYLRQRDQQTHNDFSRTPSADSAEDTAWHPFHEPIDPWAIFQDFFSDFYSSGYARSESYYQPSYLNDAFGTQSFQEGSRSPDRFAEEEEFLMDQYGQRILRKIETASYFDESLGFMHTVAQDYVRQQDFYTGGFIYQPLHIAPVVLQEDVFALEGDSSRTENESGYIPQFMDPSSLWPDVSLVRGSTMRRGSHYVQLSADCDLISYRKINDDDDPQLIWSLRESVRVHPYFGDCRLELQASQLFLYTAAENEGYVVWVSEPDFERDRRPSKYVARLDTDGALAVYRIQAPDIRHPQLSKIWKKTILEPMPSSILSIAFEFMWSLLLGKRIRRNSSGDVTFETCIVAIGSPFGCLRVGRKFVQFFRGAKALVKRASSFVDRFVDMM